MNDPLQLWIKAMRAARWEDAWEIAEASLRARDPATRDDPALPYHQRWVWDGRSFDGVDVLVRCYHGLGDTIQFARYLPALARRAASLTVEAQLALLPLLSGIPGIDRLVPFDPAQPLPPSGCDLEITELDLALRIPPPAVSAPYLKAPRAILPKGTIALCHTSGGWDAERDIAPDHFAGLCAHRPCITLVTQPIALPVRNPGGCPIDMEVTAALVAAADLVITVDTMIAHLAGALGKPVWVLLKHEPDWRWSPQSRTSPWYPGARLYTQPEPGAWGPVIQAVERDLAPGTGQFMKR